MSHSAKKYRRGDPFGFINIHSVAKFQKTRRGDPLGTVKKFQKKSHSVKKKSSKGGPFGTLKNFRKTTVPKKMKRGPFSLGRFCRLR